MIYIKKKRFKMFIHILCRTKMIIKLLLYTITPKELNDLQNHALPTTSIEAAFPVCVFFYMVRIRVLLYYFMF